MPHQPQWIFAYGSLIWHPGFDYAERQIARLAGFRRSFCMHSVHYRGTPDAPGLVLALESQDDAFCDGVAFRLLPGQAAATLAAVRARELISAAYIERILPVRLSDGRTVEAVAYAIDPGHVQYCGGLALAEQAAIIAHAAGTSGPNRQYLDNTVRHLAELGIGDPDLERLAQTVRQIVKIPAS